MKRELVGEREREIVSEREREREKKTVTWFKDRKTDSGCAKI